MTWDYTGADLRAALKEVGLERGDCVFSHSNIGYFGRMKGAAGGEDYCRGFLEGFLDVLGPRGTLILPTFTYSYCHGDPFDPGNTASVCGALSEFLRSHPRSVRSIDGNFSVAAIGARAKELTRDPADHSFGPGSFWERFLTLDGFICNLNFDSGSTFLHYAERELGVPYRYDKAFRGTTILDGERVERTFYHFVYDLSKPEDAPDFEAFDAYARKRGVPRTTALGRGEVVGLRASDCFRLVEEGLADDPHLLRKGKDAN